MNPLQPTPNILTKLGSIAIHVEEATSETGHDFDIATIKGMLTDPELREWLEEMDKLALLPKKR